MKRTFIFFWMVLFLSAFAQPIDPVLEKRAFSSMNFGDTKEAVLNKLKADPVIKWDASFEYGYIQIDESIFILYFKYYKEKLYRVILEGREQSLKYYNSSIKKAWENLVSVISKRYGKKQGDYVTFYTLKKWQRTWTHIWNYGNKEIRIGITKLSYSSLIAEALITHKSTELLIKEDATHKTITTEFINCFRIVNRRK